MSHDTITDMAVKSAPPVTVAAANIAGMPVPELVQWATLIYLVMLIGHKGWQIFKEFRGRCEPSE